MAVRDLSPTAYVAPGEASLGFSIIESNKGPDVLPLDLWVSNYSPLYDVTMNLNAGFNAIAIPDTLRCRLFILIPPRSNIVTITLKGLTGDTGLPVHPNGPIVLSIPPANPSPLLTSIGVTVGADGIPGCRIIFL